MRAFLAVLWLEFTRRGRVLAVSTVAGLLPLALPYLPGVPPTGRDVARDLTAVFLFFGCALLAGAQPGPRTTFLLSRPVPGIAAWAGRLASAWLAALAAGFLAILPATLTGGGLVGTFVAAEPLDLGVGRFVEFVAGCASYDSSGCVVRLPQAHVEDWLLAYAPGPHLAVAAVLVLYVLAADDCLRAVVRDRGSRLLLDGVGAVVLVVGLLLSQRLFFDLAARTLLARAGVVLAGIGLPACLLGSLLNEVAGRADAVRGHRFLSAGLWGTLLVTLVGVDLRVIAGLAVDLDDLGRLTWVYPSPRGTWVFLSGPVPDSDLEPILLADLTTGRLMRVGFSMGWSDNPQFSPDGRRAAWLRPRWAWGWQPVYRGHRLVSLDLSDPGAGLVEGEDPVPYDGRLVALSPDGSRVVFETYDDALLVLDVPSGRRIAAVSAVEPPHLEGVYFAGRDAVSLLRLTRGRKEGEVKVQDLVLSTLDLRTGDVTVTGTIRNLRGLRASYLRRDATGERLLLSEKDARRCTLRDGRTGAVLARLGEGGRGGRWGEFLSDGRIAVLEGTAIQWKRPAGVPRDAASARLRLLDGAGREERSFDLGFLVSPILGGEPEAGRLVVCGHPDPDDTRPLPTPLCPFCGSCLLLDLETGTSRLLGDDVLPAAFWARFASLRFGSVPPLVGSPASTFFLDADGRLLRLVLPEARLEPVDLGSPHPLGGAP